VKNSYPVTISDVARKASVSCTAVSQTLNNKGNVTPETQEHVWTASIDKKGGAYSSQ
jgi:DNA-binding LacI/PurR family transcriptional regulator